MIRNGLGMALALVVGCEPARSGPPSEAPPRDAQPAAAGQRALPAPDREDGAALFGVIARRRSERELGGPALGDTELGQLLWAAQGVTGDDGKRAAPSAGALYPLTLRVADAGGLWRYLPDEHALVRERGDDRRDELAAAGFDQPALREAPAVFVISGREEITAAKYGGSRAGRYVAIEAGHAAHGLLLAATALDLRSVPIGAFDDQSVRDALGLDAEDTPLYLLPVGRSR